MLNEDGTCNDPMGYCEWLLAELEKRGLDWDSAVDVCKEESSKPETNTIDMFERAHRNF
jgi:hypothetical protein